jgi:peroxiredoxin
LEDSSLGITEKDIAAIANQNFYKNERSAERNERINMQQNRSSKNLNSTNTNQVVKKHPKINTNICSTSPTHRKINTEHRSPKNSD